MQNRSVFHCLKWTEYLYLLEQIEEAIDFIKQKPDFVNKMDFINKAKCKGFVHKLKEVFFCTQIRLFAHLLYKVIIL